MLSPELSGEGMSVEVLMDGVGGRGAIGGYVVVVGCVEGVLPGLVEGWLLPFVPAANESQFQVTLSIQQRACLA